MNYSLNNPNNKPLPNPTPEEQAKLLRQLANILHVAPIDSAKVFEDTENELKDDEQDTKESLAEQGDFDTLDELDEIDKQLNS